MDGGIDPTTALVQTEDAVQALMEHLVCPLLPIRVTSLGPPMVDQQEAVAKQMSAVVLLYNYYHRKQFPKLEFLGFECFCKVAVTAKPSLSLYMKYMSKQKEDTDLDKQLSITEKMIMDACNIGSSLDASKDYPSVENWPISKVAIFLVDITKQTCLLRFGNITQGVWSLLEKDIELSSDEVVGGLLMKTNEPSGALSGPESRGIESILEEFAFSTVKQRAGIDKSSLNVLEHHKAYSLTEDKTSTQLYIMSFREAVNEDFVEMPIKDVLSSLRGPLFMSDAAPEVTPVVEHYHLLPYITILEDWYARESVNNGLNGMKSKANTETLEEPTNGDHHMTGKSDQNEENSNFLISEMSKIDQNEETPEPDHYMNDKSYQDEKTPNLLINEMIKNGNVTVEEKEVDPSFLLPPNLTKEPDDAITSNSFSDMNISIDKDTMKNTVIQSKVVSDSLTNGSAEALRNIKSDDLSISCHIQQSHHEGIEGRNETVPDPHIDKIEMGSHQICVNVATDGHRGEVGVVGSVKEPCIITRKEGDALRVTAPNDAVQDITATCDLPLIPLSSSEKHGSFHLQVDAKKTNLLDASLRILHKKRDELCRQRYLLEDGIAKCEMNIQSILNGGKEKLASNMEFILETCNDLLSSQACSPTPLYFEEQSMPQTKRKRLYEAVLCLHSPCQELDSICSENGWILPRYGLFPSFSEGRFHARVTVHGLDFELTSTGELKGSPREARESAALNLLNKLRGMAGERHSDR